MAGRTIALAAKFSDAEVAIIDTARGEVTRSEWLRTVALAAAGKPAPRTSPPTGKPGRVPFREPEPLGRLATVPGPARKNCTHPGVIKGICHAPGCGEWVGAKR